MDLTFAPLRRAVLLAVLSLLLSIPAAAQEAAYPTVDALETAVIPPRDRVALAERLLGITDIPPTPASAAPRQVGEQQVFTAANSDADRIFTIPATLRVVGEHIYLWVEDGAPLSQDDLQALADRFDTQIYPQVRDLWGSEATPGIDGDPRIYGLFASGLGASVAAYFASDHTVPRAVAPVSNQHEMFFFNLDAIGSRFSVEQVGSIVAHEFQHMIRANLQINTETWLNEGLSEFTQYFLYDEWASSIMSFLYAPGTQLNDWNADSAARSANYGAAALFLIYFDQRYGEEAMRLLSEQRTPRGLQAVDNVLAALGEPDVNNLFADWVLANALFDTTFADGRFGYQNLPEVAASVTPVQNLPFAVKGEVNQYATSYYRLTDLQGITALSLQLEASATAALIPATALNGDWFWYSNRGDMGDATLTRAFDLSATSDATLNYRVWYDTERYWDYGYVMVSEDDGASWEILPTPLTTTDDPQGVAYGAGYTGVSGGWVEESLALDQYAGEEILVRFEVITDDAVTRPGLAVDDVSIPEIGYTENFEVDNGGWQAEGWLWTDNRLPQQGWLQVVQQAENGEIISVERWLLGETNYTLALDPGTVTALVAVSPHAPVTTVAMPYTLRIEKR